MPDYAQTKSTFTNEYLTPIIDGARNDAVGLVDYVFRYANRLETSFASGDAVVDVGGMCVGSRKFETTAPINIPLTDNSYFVIYGYTKLGGTEESGIGVKFDTGDFPTLIQDDLQTNLTGRREVAIYRGFKSGGVVTPSEDVRPLETIHQEKRKVLWTGSITDGNPMPIVLNNYPQYDYFIGYITNDTIPIVLHKNDVKNIVVGSYSNLIASITSSGFTTIGVLLTTFGGGTSIKRQTNTFNGNNSNFFATNIIKIEGVKL